LFLIRFAYLSIEQYRFIYEIKGVEGQLKVVQEKLQFSQENFNELLKKEKKQ